MKVALIRGGSMVRYVKSTRSWRFFVCLMRAALGFIEGCMSFVQKRWRIALVAVYIAVYAAVEAFLMPLVTVRFDHCCDADTIMLAIMIGGRWLLLPYIVAVLTVFMVPRIDDDAVFPYWPAMAMAAGLTVAVSHLSNGMLLANPEWGLLLAWGLGYFFSSCLLRVLSHERALVREILPFEQALIRRR